MEMILKFDDHVAKDLAQGTEQDKDVDGAVVYEYLKSMGTTHVSVKLGEMVEDLSVYTREELEEILETLMIWEYIDLLIDDNNEDSMFINIH